MDLGSILDFLEGRSILVTGATGFLAKIFVEKILRVQPNVKKLYLLLRAADANSAMQRFNTEVIAKDLFRVLREKHGRNLSSFISEKVVVVAGDISCENLGIKDRDLLEEMWEQVEVVVNLAATTNFDERYDVSLDINTFGAIHALNFSKKCLKLKVHVHVSTAYVCGETEGLVIEAPYYLGETLNDTSGLDVDREKKVVEETLKQLRIEDSSQDLVKSAMKDLGIQSARKYGWPNTYVFTKAMGEMLLGHMKDSVPLVIIRPTIVTSTYKEPFPGWVEGIRTIDSIAVAYGKGRLTCFLGNPTTILDLIPADMVVNAMIVAMAAHANHTNEQTIYHIGSSLSNPITSSMFQEYGLQYFTKHPWIDKQGKLVIVGKVKVLSTMDCFQSYMTVRYLLPLKGLQIVNAACCQYFRAEYLNLYRKIKYVMRLIDLYRPYLFFKGVFDDINTEKLRRAARDNDVETDMFYFDPKIIKWSDYMMGIHLAGVVKYLFK